MIDNIINEFGESNKRYARARRNKFVYGRQIELTLAELEVFRVIGSAGDITPMEIAELQGRTKGAVSQVIEKLRIKCLIDFYENLEDLRKKQFILTDLGKQVYQEDAQRRKNLGLYLCDSLPDLSEAELIACHAIMQRIREGIHAYFEGMRGEEAK